MSSISDQTATGQRFRMLSVVDVFTWECLVIVPGQSQGLAMRSKF